MKDLTRVNMVFSWITGILFAAFGLLFLLEPVFSPGIEIWMAAAVLCVAALVRLVLFCLPGSGETAGGSQGLDIVTGILEALFGALFVLNQLAYIENFYWVVAAVLTAAAIVRLMQSAKIRKRGNAGGGAFVLIAILLFVAAAGLIIMTTVWKIDMLAIVTGAAVFMYGIFLLATSFYKAGGSVLTELGVQDAEQEYEGESDPLKKTAG